MYRFFYQHLSLVYTLPMSVPLIPVCLCISYGYTICCLISYNLAIVCVSMLLQSCHKIRINNKGVSSMRERGREHLNC